MTNVLTEPTRIELVPVEVLAPPARAQWVDPHAASLEQFRKDTARHRMTVLHDDGVYRHLRFQEPGTSVFYFDLLTSPGLLTVNGDMGTYSFARLHDMFDFFHDNGYGINPGYWGEKLVAHGREGYREHSAAAVVEQVTEHFEEDKADYEPEEQAAIWAEITDQILDVADDSNQVHNALSNFSSDHHFEYYDTWEWDFETYTSHFLWACQSILWGVQQYKAADAAFRAPFTSKRWVA